MIIVLLSRQERCYICCTINANKKFQCHLQRKFLKSFFIHYFLKNVPLIFSCLVIMIFCFYMKQFTFIKGEYIQRAQKIDLKRRVTVKAGSVNRATGYFNITKTGMIFESKHLVLQQRGTLKGAVIESGFRCISPILAVTSNPTRCADSQFNCAEKSLSCVAATKKCDGIVDCKEGKDELNCPLDPNQFKLKGL